MGNCNDSPRKSAGHVPPQQMPQRQKGGGGGGRSNQRHLREGDSIVAWWKEKNSHGTWYEAVIERSNGDGTFDIRWTVDGSRTYGVGSDFIRPNSGVNTVQPASPASQRGNQLFAALGGKEGTALPYEHVRKMMRDPSIIKLFGWVEGYGDDLAAMLCTTNGRRSDLTAEQTGYYATVQWLFARIDEDRNGKISAWELETALLQDKEVCANLGMGPEMANPLFRQMDADNSGWISLVEFYRYYSTTPMKRSLGSIEALFAQLDADRSGTITSDELRRALERNKNIQLELGWPAHRSDILFGLLDQDGSGTVTMDELRTYMRIQIIFNIIDTNRSGFIDTFEFGEALANRSISTELQVRQSDALRIFQQIDTDRSNTINFAEFFRYFVRRLGPDCGVVNQQLAGQVNIPKPSKPGDMYEKIKKLGEGTFGVVFLIKRKSDGLDLIMKKPKPETVTDMNDVKAEADMLSRLKHPHIIRFQESYWEGKALIIVTEFAGGGDLSSQIPKNRGCGEERAFTWFIELLDAVNYLHQRFILHRDLKPDNVFLSKGLSVKVGDLGLATQLKDGFDMASSICGTPVYMAPELFNGRPYSAPNDVWALGCIMYEMATGKLAYTGYSNAARPPRDCPRWCEGIVYDILQERPSDRPTCKELLKDLGVEDDPGNFGFFYGKKSGGGGGGNRGGSPISPSSYDYGYDDSRYYDHR